jgi:hypothetical protein
MVAAEAAGTAAAYSVNNDVTFRQMASDAQAIKWLQNQLISQGAFIMEFHPPHVPVMDHWAYPGVLVMREFGMAAGGYENDYRLDVQQQTKYYFQISVNAIMRIARERITDENPYHIPRWRVSLDTDNITVGLLLTTAAECASMGDEAWLAQFHGDGDDNGSGNRNGNINVSIPHDIEPMVFHNAETARDYLLTHGIINSETLPHFYDIDAISTYGQIMYILGNLYTMLVFAVES